MIARADAAACGVRRGGVRFYAFLLAHHVGALQPLIADAAVADADSGWVVISHRRGGARIFAGARREASTETTNVTVDGEAVAVPAGRAFVLEIAADGTREFWTPRAMTSPPAPNQPGLTPLAVLVALLGMFVMAVLIQFAEILVAMEAPGGARAGAARHRGLPRGARARRAAGGVSRVRFPFAARTALRALRAADERAADDARLLAPDRRHRDDDPAHAEPLREARLLRRGLLAARRERAGGSDRASPLTNTSDGETSEGSFTVPPGAGDLRADEHVLVSALVRATDLGPGAAYSARLVSGADEAREVFQSRAATRATTRHPEGFELMGSYALRLPPGAAESLTLEVSLSGRGTLRSPIRNCSRSRPSNRSSRVGSKRRRTGRWRSPATRCDRAGWRDSPTSSAATSRSATGSAGAGVDGVRHAAAGRGVCSQRAHPAQMDGRRAFPHAADADPDGAARRDGRGLLHAHLAEPVLLGGRRTGAGVVPAARLGILQRLAAVIGDQRAAAGLLRPGMGQHVGRGESARLRGDPESGGLHGNERAVEPAHRVLRVSVSVLSGEPGRNRVGPAIRDDRLPAGANDGVVPGLRADPGRAGVAALGVGVARGAGARAGHGRGRTADLPLVAGAARCRVRRHGGLGALDGRVGGRRVGVFARAAGRRVRLGAAAGGVRHSLRLLHAAKCRALRADAGRDRDVRARVRAFRIHHEFFHHGVGLLSHPGHAARLSSSGGATTSGLRTWRSSR